MDTTAVESRSEGLAEKRPLENGVQRDLGNKRARGGGEDVELSKDVKKVAEIVLVLATMGKMRGGKKPTPTEVELMAEARGKLAEVCKEFAPKDIFPRDAFGTVIEDLGLNRLREQKLGIRPPKMSIAEKLQLTKQKMEKSEVFPLHATAYTPQGLHSSSVKAPESRGTTQSVRIFASDRANKASISSGSFQQASTSSANSRTLPYQLPTSEVRPGVSNNVLPGSHLGRDSSSLSASRVERANFRLDGRSNGSPYTSQSQANSSGDHSTVKTPTWSMQPQSASFVKVGSDRVLAHGSVKTDGSSDVPTSRMASQAVTSRPIITQTTPSNPTNINHPMQRGMNFVHAPSTADTHNEISKIVQKLLQPNLPEHPIWNPPSRDYMNKALTCQMCKGMINEVDSALVCDACERGYHLRCLHCNAKAIPRGGEWHCAKCLAISNGKPLPPKYGRVMRNISTPKLPSGTTALQPSLEKRLQASDDNANQQMVAANGNTGSQTASCGTMENSNDSTHEHGNVKSSLETCPSDLVGGSRDGKMVTLPESQPPASSQEVTGLSNHLQALGGHQDDNQARTPSVSTTVSNQPQGKNLLANVPEEFQSGGKIGSDPLGETKDNRQGIGQGSPVKTQEGSSSSSLNDVEWVGGILKVVDGKTYYQSCCINGTVYKVHDYALFSSTGKGYLPNKLQAMWEDSTTSSKWVTVTRCYFPGDLPEGVGRPCAPESNEVYESNHESTLIAGLIHGPCEVLSPSKFPKESVTQSRLGTEARDRPKPLFLCKWFYDETKRLFRDVTC